MFNTPRWHRLLTVPALLLAIAVLVAGPHPLLALGICPVLVAVPFQLYAAWNRDLRAVAKALQAMRAIGYLGLAWGIVALFIAPIAGAIMCGVFVGMLVAAGTGVDERRLAVVAMITGAAIAVGSLVMLWFGAVYLALAPAGALLLAGGTWWLGEASRAPVTATDATELPVAIAV